MSETFQATVELFGKTATGFRVPAAVVAALGERKRPPVRVTGGSHPYRSTVAPYGDWFFLPLNRQNRQAAGLAPGDEVAVILELDTDPRSVEVPPALAEALAETDEARVYFEELSSSHQREYVELINDAKRPATQDRRVARAIEMLAEGRAPR